MIRRAYHAIRIALAKRRLDRARKAYVATIDQYAADLRHYRQERARARLALTEAQADAAIAGCLHLDREWA